jgi:hypothetical protein
MSVPGALAAAASTTGTPARSLAVETSATLY